MPGYAGLIVQVQGADRHIGTLISDSTAAPPNFSHPGPAALAALVIQVHRCSTDLAQEFLLKFRWSPSHVVVVVIISSSLSISQTTGNLLEHSPLLSTAPHVSNLVSLKFELQLLLPTVPSLLGHLHLLQDSSSCSTLNYSASIDSIAAQLPQKLSQWQRERCAWPTLVSSE